MYPISNIVIRWHDAYKTIGEVVHADRSPIGCLTKSGLSGYIVYRFLPLTRDEVVQRDLPLLYLSKDAQTAPAPNFHGLHQIGEFSLDQGILTLTGQAEYTEVFETFPEIPETRLQSPVSICLPELPDPHTFLSLHFDRQKDFMDQFLSDLFLKNPQISPIVLRRAFRTVWGRYPTKAQLKSLSATHPTHYAKSASIENWPTPIPKSFSSITERNDYIARLYSINPGASLKNLASALEEKLGITLTRAALQLLLKKAGIDTSRGKKNSKSKTKGKSHAESNLTSKP